MRLSEHGRLAIFAAIATAAATGLGLAGWPQADHAREFSALIAAAILISAFAKPSFTAEGRGMMPASFVVDFSALFFLGGPAALVTAAAGTTTRWLLDAARARPRRAMLLNAATVMFATEAASLAYAAAGGAPAPFTWPGQAIPMAAATVAYCVVKSLSAEAIAPLLSGGTLRRSWPSAVLRVWPHYFVSAGIAAGLVEIAIHE